MKKLFLIHSISLSLLLVGNFSRAEEPATSPRCNEFTFDASASHDPNNQNIKYLWDFGDGTTSTEQIATHTYQKSGDYTVTLTINNNANLECSVAKTTQKVRVTMAPHAKFITADIICANQTVGFDGSSSKENSSNATYEWNFGDGTKVSGQKKTTKAFAKGGDYKVTLTVDDHQKTSCSRSTTEQIVHVQEPPSAEAGDEVLLKCVSEPSDLTVNFDASASANSNENLKYTWEFGDGTSQDGIKVSHEYKQTGNYEVKLIVKDPDNLSCGTGVDFMTVRLNEGPKANAGADLVTCGGEDIVFDGSDSSQYKKGAVSAEWFFGDGQTAKGLKVNHTYNKPGKYQATLSLESNLNAMCPQSRDTRLVTVNSAPTVTLKSVDHVCTGSAVSLDASSASDPDGDTLNYRWSFGDGETTSGSAKVTHEYKRGGNYMVNVIVDDGQNSACSSNVASKNIQVNSAPIADMGPNSACCANKETQFNANASSDPDGDELTYLWDLGDGTKEQGAKIRHTYKDSGQYNVTLTVDDGKGTSCSKSSANFVASVNASPVPVIQIR